ncbi:MAG TPA: histidine phosphatase family protein [Bacteroidia bacterium]|nr:histidine phosphatase family protein [Bacteroidia bacterium]HRS57774.1 histidine phosphatase family protein [Bacteroidia bacterium]HRU67285.1 histidine phosphatase family protein [Bacteroidia bacterium]
MKQLFIVRHGHAQNQTAGKSDHERPLSDPGRDEVRQLSETFRKNGFVPEKIISSTALRALETAKIIASAFEIHADEIVAEDLLYSFYDTNDFIDMLQTYVNDCQKVCVVGHNPLLAEMIFAFTGKQIVPLSPASAVVIEIESDSWQTLTTQKGILKFVVSR